MSMTRKDYRAIAEQIKWSLKGANEDATQGVAQTARNVADALKADNSRFRYDTFFEACGLDSYGYPVKEA